MGRAGFKSKSGGESVTKKTSYQSTRRFGHKIVVIDTPGLADTTLSENEVLAEVLKSFTITSPGPHAFLLILRPERITKLEEEIMLRYQKLFGEHFMKHLIIVFTDKYRLEVLDEITIEQYLRSLRPGNTLETLLNAVDSRYINIGYSKDFDNPARKSEVLKILDFVLKIKENRGFATTYLKGKAEEIYKQIVKVKIEKQQERMKQTTDTNSHFQNFRDDARKKFLDYYLDVAVDTFIRVFQGSDAKFMYEILSLIHSIVEEQ